MLHCRKYVTLDINLISRHRRRGYEHGSNGHRHPLLHFSRPGILSASRPSSVLERRLTPPVSGMAFGGRVPIQVSAGLRGTGSE
jgi:hypothetical protein